MNGHGGRGGGRPGGRFDNRGGGRVGGRGGFLDRQSLERDGIMVRTNTFPIKLNNDIRVTLCEVQIVPMFWQKDETTGERTLVVAPDMKPFFKDPQEALDGDPSASKILQIVPVQNRSSELTRAIMLAYQEQFEERERDQCFVTDGAATAWLVQSLESYLEPDQKKQKLVPEHTGATWEQLVKAEVRVERKWFQVSLKATEVINLEANVDGKVVSNNTLNQDKHQRMLTAFMNILVKNARMRITAMKSFGRSPNTSYFTNPDELLSFFMSDPRGRRGTETELQKCLKKPVAPIMGIRESVQITSSGDARLRADFRPNWAYSDKSRRNGEPLFPILAVHPGGGRVTIAGVVIPNAQEPVPPELRASVENALKKRKFTISYVRAGDSQWAEAEREKWTAAKRRQGKSEDWIAEKWVTEMLHFKTTREVWRYGEKAQEPVVIWEGADGIEFRPKKDGPLLTVKSYYETKFGLQLKHPNMPLIRTGKKEYFPIEFFSQAQELYRNANSDQQSKAVLELHDNVCGSRRIDRLISMLCPNRDFVELSEVAESMRLCFRKMNLTVEETPMTVKAEVLTQPTPRFKNREARVVDGSWYLAEFAAPAELRSFAVIDLSGATSVKLFKNLCEACRSLKMVLPTKAEEIVSQIAVTPTLSTDQFRRLDLAAMYELFKSSIEKARDHFLRSDVYSFKSQVRNHEGSCRTCFVKRAVKPADELPVIPPNPEAGWQMTHFVQLKKTSRWHKARLKYRVEQSFVDPFNFSGSVDNARVAFEVEQDIGTYMMIDEDALLEVKESITAPLEDVCCPSIVFVIFPEEDKHVWSMVKHLSNVDFSIQSQVIVGKSFARQKSPNRKSQYCSNIALKVNAKLAPFHGVAASAWHTYPTPADDWVAQVPTLIIGIATASAQGQDSKMVVVGTARLDNVGLTIGPGSRIQRKREVMADEAMHEIIMSLACQFFRFNRKRPERVVIYRNGGDDGLSDAIVNKELKAIKGAFDFFHRDFSIEEVPPITMIVAQSHHNSIIVPTNYEQKNVPSGTCVDETSGLFSTSSGAGFFLTAQGGLKGTSKTVFYQCIVNENLEPGDDTNMSPLTVDILKQLTYSLSFNYATATKAPRLPMLLKYSMRLAESVVGYLESLFQHGSNPFSPMLEGPENIYRRANGDGRIHPGFDPYFDGSFSTPFHPHTAA